METKALDKRISFTMFIKNLGDKLQSIMKKSISPEEKLDLIISEMEKDTQQKRVMARNIRTQMIALSDPDTKDLEPLEKLRVKRAKLVEQGKVAMAKGEQATVNRLAQEVKAISASLSSTESTYETLKESYKVALENYKIALTSLEHSKNNGKTMLFAIKVHQDALKMRDRAQESTASDVSFLNDLTKELENTQNELKSDKQIESEISSDTPDTQEEIDESILNEFKS